MLGRRPGKKRETEKLTLHQAVKNKDDVLFDLLKSGSDVNCKSDGVSVLHAALEFSPEEEIIAAILCHGAVPEMADLEYSAINCDKSICDLLILHIFEETSNFLINFEVLLNLAVKNCEYFLLVLNGSEIWCDRLKSTVYRRLFCEMNSENFGLLVSKYSDTFKDLMLRDYCNLVYIAVSDETKLGIVLEKEELREHIVDYNIIHYYACLVHELDFFDRKQLEFFFWVMLTYGLPITTATIHTIYNNWGVCKLLELCLTLDITFIRVPRFYNCVEPAMLCDVTLDIATFLKYPQRYSKEKVEVLLRFFCHPELNTYCLKLNHRLSNIMIELPRVPHLAQLARDTFRKFLITKLAIKSSKELVLAVQQLTIPNLHKRIILLLHGIYFF